jgi:hypothetical protein
MVTDAALWLLLAATFGWVACGCVAARPRGPGRLSSPPQFPNRPTSSSTVAARNQPVAGCGTARPQCRRARPAFEGRIEPGSAAGRVETMRRYANMDHMHPLDPRSGAVR